MAERQLRWTAEALDEFADQLDRTRFDVIDPELRPVGRWIGRGLTVYDATYVALAEQLNIPLITVDRTILKMAPRLSRPPT